MLVLVLDGLFKKTSLLLWSSKSAKWLWTCLHALWTGLVAGAGLQQMAFWIHDRSGAMFRQHMFHPVAIYFVESGIHNHHHGSTTTTFVLTPTRAHVSMRCPLIQPERQNRGKLLSFTPFSVYPLRGWTVRTSHQTFWVKDRHSSVQRSGVRCLIWTFFEEG